MAAPSPEWYQQEIEALTAEKNHLFEQLQTVREESKKKDLQITELKREHHNWLSFEAAISKATKEADAAQVQLGEAMTAIRLIAPFCKVKYGMDEEAVAAIEKLSDKRVVLQPICECGRPAAEHGGCRNYRPRVEDCDRRSPPDVAAGTLTCSGKRDHKERHHTFWNGEKREWD